MTGPTRRELENRVKTLRERGGEDRPGFWYFKIGGDPEPEKAGHYRYDDERECYVNKNGHSREDKPNCEFGGGATDEEQAAIREALSGISDEEADR